jgi:hypothetical protein
MRVVQAAIFIATLAIAVFATARYVGRDLGSLVITTDPPGATVSVAGKDLGKTPYSRFLPVGVWDVQIQKEGYLSQTTQVTIASNKRVRCDFILPRIGSSGSVIAKFSSASARVVNQTGTVEVRPAGSQIWVPCQTNLTLNPHDRIRTLGNSTATISLEGVTLYKLSELSELELMPEPSKPGFIDLLRGEIYLFSNGRNNIQAKTPHATGTPKG